MSDTNNTTYEAITASIDYQVFQHHMCYDDNAIEPPNEDEIITYSVSKHKIKPEDALIDRGANGSLLGDDTRKISSPAIPKFVNASGITPHQLTNIPVITAGAYCETKRGGVILIFHEAAYKGSGNSILSAIQMEAHCNKVDEKALGLGGNQIITAPGGFCIPMKIANGLPYFEMRPFTDEEWIKLPHIEMISPQPWDPRKYDNEIDMKKFKESIPQDLHLLPNKDYSMVGQFISVNKTEFMNPNEPRIKFWIPELAH